MGLSGSFMQCWAHSTRSMGGGLRNRSELRVKWAQELVEKWLNIMTCAMCCSRLQSLAIVRVNDQWLVRRLTITWSSPSILWLWLWLTVFIIKWIDNLIWLNSARSDYKDTFCILSGSFNCHDRGYMIGEWSWGRIQIQRWCMQGEMISWSESD